MKFIDAPQVGLGLLCLALAAPLHAQSLDWGSWNSSGTGTYSNGGSITISGLVNGSVDSVYGETAQPHAITDASFPYDNSPVAGQYGHFHNAEPTFADWSILIDLSGFALNPGTVIGFSNLDGRAAYSLLPGYATLQFLDSDGNSVPISPASLIGNFDSSWQGITWDANSVFNPSTGRWDVIADSGATHPAGSYFAAVGDAFFLTNLPSNVQRIVYTKTGGSDYLYDSILFYAGQSAVVPEPASCLLVGLAGLGFAARRRRRIS